VSAAAAAAAAYCRYHDCARLKPRYLKPLKPTAYSCVYRRGTLDGDCIFSSEAQVIFSDSGHRRHLTFDSFVELTNKTSR